MALQTKGFALSALPEKTKIPGNVGMVDVKEIYDGVQRGLAAYEAVRRAPQSMVLADAQMKAGIEQAPLATRGILAETEAKEQQGPLRTGILAQQAAVAKDQAPYKQAILEAQASPAFLDAQIKKMLFQHVPAGAREFELLTANFTPEQKERARLIHLGMEGRASSAAVKYQKFTGSDGREYTMGLDPNAVGAQVIGTAETYGSGVVRPGTFPAQVAAPIPVAPATAAVPAADIDELGVPIGAATVPPPQTTATPQAAAPAGNIFQSPTIAEKKTKEVTAGKTAEMIVDAKTKLPKAKSSLEALESSTARIEADIDEAINLSKGNTTGFASLLKALPATDARKLDNLLDTIRTNVGFGALSEMRLNSPTGGALGNVSDYENKNLQATIAALDQAMASGDVKGALRKVKEARREALTRTRNAYERDLDYFGIPDVPATGSAPKAAPSGEFKIIEVK